MLKKIILFFALSLSGFALKAQYNYSQWGVGIGASSVLSYSDLRQNNPKFSVNADVYYNYSPYVPFAFEIQAGQLSGGNENTDPSHRHFANSFISVSLHGDLQLGEIIDFNRNAFLDVVKGFYVGTGVGLTHNNITDIRRNAKDAPDYVFPGTNSSINALIPLRFGYEFKIFNYNDEPFMAIDIGYIHNLTFAEGLDGYNDPPAKFKNNAQDMFHQITVGLKLNFGQPVAYIKPVR